MKSSKIPLIHAVDLVHSFWKNPLFEDLSFDIDAGEIFLITGPSGVGKTTLLSLIWGIERIQSGKIEYNSDLLPRARWFGYAFIDGPFFETLTVRENILLLENFSDIWIDNAHYRELLEYFEINTFENASLISLSVGQRERVGFVRALVHRPQVVIMDEPGSNLDIHLFDKLFTYIQKEQKEYNTTFVIVSHDERFKKIASQQIELTPIA